ncbi:MAG: HsdR family type I site-specific deoxyribonuclease [Patescibacteria group bacterium]
MTHQSEQQLEKELVEQLGGLGFLPVVLEDTSAMIANLHGQLDKFNQTNFSDSEFIKILNHLDNGDRFHKAKTLRDRYALTRDDESTFYVRFFNMDQWCKNEYQVAQQITQVGRYENRYDVTLLINGLPLVQIELKRRGMELKEAFNQIQRYHKHSFTGTLFEYIQIFVISNGVNTKYFANNPKQSFEQTFFWTDEENRKITKLSEFADIFLEKCAVSEMIAEYIVLAEAGQIPMVLRPYQYYAVRSIEERVRESDKNGYIWHTTGSGKTLTSYKASQILSRIPEVKKVLFVVDRKDIDIQTTQEFNSFSEGSVDGTDNTQSLVNQLKDKNRKLIVTTIQKLDIAIGRSAYMKEFEYLVNEKVVIIFDECHRSQFGQTHARIKAFFSRAQLFGFTGTPIFADNNVAGVTTVDVFTECLHKYIITHAIDDNNVLGFAVEYVGKYKQKSADTLDADIFADAVVEGIDTKEVLESPDRLDKIADYVLADWKRKT